MGGAKSPPPTSFSPDVKYQVLNWYQSQIIELEPIPPLKEKRFFWSNPYKIVAIISFLIQMLELPNFSHMTTSIL